MVGPSTIHFQPYTNNENHKISKPSKVFGSVFIKKKSFRPHVAPTRIILAKMTKKLDNIVEKLVKSQMSKWHLFPKMPLYTVEFIVCI